MKNKRTNGTLLSGNSPEHKRWVKYRDDLINRSLSFPVTVFLTDRFMKKLQGIAVSPGIAIGEAMVLGHEGFRIPNRYVKHEFVETEVERLKAAIAEASDGIGREPRFGRRGTGAKVRRYSRHTCKFSTIRNSTASLPS